MTETQRWLQTGQAPPDVLDLLKSARPPRALDAPTQARSRRRLVAMTALPAAAGVVFWVKSVALGAILGGAVLAITVVPKMRSESGARVPLAASSRAVLRAVTPTNASPTQTAGDTMADAPTAASVLRSPGPMLAPSDNIASAASAFPPANLARETQLLEQARQLLGSNPTLALNVLEQHRHEFPNGVLELERELLSVDALLRLGRRAEAQQRAAQMRARAPGSIYERRLSQLMGE